MPARKFTDDQEAEICRRYEAGENTRGLANAYGAVPATIWKILRRTNAKIRNLSESQRKFSNTQEEDICREYVSGSSMPRLAARYQVQACVIHRVLRRNNIECRTISEAFKTNRVHKKLSEAQELEIAKKYTKGKTSVELGAAYDLDPGTIINIVRRNDGNVRDALGFGDSVQHIFDCAGLHTHHRECEFYVYELARYANTHCKPGIAFDSCARADAEYGEEVLRLVFATRAEAYFLEQAVLDATRGYRDCPEDLVGWDGASEVRAMPAEDLLPVIDRLAAELELLGVWAFAAAYVPMTAAQRAQCQQRAQLSPVA